MKTIKPYILIPIGLMLSANAFALLNSANSSLPVAQPGQAQSQSTAGSASTPALPSAQQLPQIPVDILSGMEIGPESMEATNLQMETAKEKIKAEHLKQQIERIKLERDLELMKGGVSLSALIDGQEASKQDDSKKQSKTEGKPKQAKPVIVEIMGTNKTVSAKIFGSDGSFQSYSVGDKFPGSNGARITHITKKGVALSSGKAIYLK